MVIQNRVRGTGRARVDRLVDTYLRAEAAADVDTVLSLTTTDVGYESIGFEEIHASGVSAVRAHYQDEFANVVHERDTTIRRLHGDGFVVDERLWDNRVIGRLGPYVGRGRRVQLRVLRIFELRRDQVARVSVYPDLAAIMRQLS
jgi:limonene-1,2-epoxide hydrolase